MVSVVMTTYNGEKYIEEQMNSLIQQSLHADEVLIADDGSSDSTVAIIEKFISDNKLDNWTIIKNQTNKGWRRNFVETAQKAKGNYIFFCDQDDIWLPNKIETMISAMQADDIYVLAGKYVEFENELPNFNAGTGKIYRVHLDNHLLYTEYPGCVYCVKKEFWDKICCYWNEIFSHDAMCWAAAKLLRKAFIIDTPVIYWRRHYDSTYTKASREIKNRKNRIEWLKNTLMNVKCLEQILDGFTVNQDVYFKLRKYTEFISMRIGMLEKRQLLNSLRLLKYINFYNKKRQYFFEVYIAVFK